ncbi:MAG: hypothetical protein Q4D80_05705 [Pseudomonadota bacterium]|nr:hypothetical protein [Pseudomonadota bacterium]
MTKTVFVNKYGAVFQTEDVSVEKTECCYIVVVKNDSLLCFFDKISGLYSFPEEKYLSLSEKPTLQYTLHANVEENGRYFEETQVFKVYDVEKARVEGDALSWQQLEDILVGNVLFDARLKKGFNNLIVRGEK